MALAYDLLHATFVAHAACAMLNSHHYHRLWLQLLQGYETCL